MSEKRDLCKDDPASKRQKTSAPDANDEGGNIGQQEQADEDEEDDNCIVCMRTEAELLTADCPMRDEHGCSRCNKTSWYSILFAYMSTQLMLTSITGSQENMRGMRGTPSEPQVSVVSWCLCAHAALHLS